MWKCARENTADVDVRTPCKESCTCLIYFFASLAGAAVTWLLMTSRRPRPQRTGASSRLSSRPPALPTWPTSNPWRRNRTSLPSAQRTAHLSTCFVSTTKVRDEHLHTHTQACGWGFECSPIIYECFVLLKPLSITFGLSTVFVPRVKVMCRWWDKCTSQPPPLPNIDLYWFTFSLKVCWIRQTAVTGLLWHWRKLKTWWFTGKFCLFSVISKRIYNKDVYSIISWFTLSLKVYISCLFGKIGLYCDSEKKYDFWLWSTSRSIFA